MTLVTEEDKSNTLCSSFESIIKKHPFFDRERITLSALFAKHRESESQNLRLYEASLQGCLSEIKSLLKKGANPNFKHINDWTPLHAAASAHMFQREAVKLLIQKGANINEQDEFGNTALHIAAHKGNRKLFIYLVQNGALKDIKNKKGKTPYQCIESELVKFLLHNIVEKETKHPGRDVFKVYRAKKANQVLFQPERSSGKDIYNFLKHVVCGEHAKVKEMLEENIHLLFKRVKITDCSERTFFKISGFEYVLWALDKHMWTMMLDCIPQNEEGKAVLERLLVQYKQLEAKGVTYGLNGKAITEKHFDFKNTIIKALQTQVDLYYAPEPKNWRAIDKQWREGVGGAQKLLPMHVVNEYCSNEPFYPVPNFTSRLTTSKQFYNRITRKEEDWFGVDSKLAVDFAIYRGVRDRAVAYGCASTPLPLGAGADLIAVTALCEKRTNEFINLESQLEEQMLVGAQLKVL